MPAKDTYQNAVKNALIKDGWTITADPYPIKYEEVKLVADLASRKRQIVIEIKSFLSRSPMREFETALGQYLIYKTFLSINQPNCEIYLAIGKDIYQKFFEQVAIQLILKTYQVSLLVVDLNLEEIIQWTN